jgi:uncharacterized protein (DUF1697 family)
MPVYIALLRGVNVAGNLLKMEQLREWCAELGWENVRTYVQSGNLVFQTRAGIPKWQAALEQKLAAEMKRPVAVIGRTPAELELVLGGNPFMIEQGIDLSRLHVTFLATVPAPASIEALGSLKSGGDRFAVRGREVYLHCPNGYGETKLSNAAFEKVLAVKATTRNWNTVNKLVQMAKI